jgi:MFS family permease
MPSISRVLSARIWPSAGPLRPIACGRLLTSVGDGAWYTSWAIFLTRSVGLSPAEVGIGMTLAGVVGLLLATPLGHLADRAGAREVRIGMLLLQGIATLAYLWVHSFALFLPIAIPSCPSLPRENERPEGRSRVSDIAGAGYVLISPTTTSGSLYRVAELRRLAVSAGKRVFWGYARLSPN